LIIRGFTDFSVFVFLPFVVGGVDRLLNQVIGPGPDRFDAVTEVIDLGCPWYLVLLGFDLELCRVLVSKLVRLIIRCFTDFPVFVILPFVFGDVDRLLNQVIGPGPDRFDAVTGMINLGCPWCLVLLGFDLELCRVLVSRLIRLIIWYSTVLFFVFLPFVFGGVGRWLNLVIGLDFDRFNAVMGVIDLGCPRYLVLLGFDLELCRVLVSKLVL
jgi:hypothetical protein